MKKLLRTGLINLVCLWLVASLIKGVTYAGQAGVLLLAAGALTLVNFLLKPLVKVLLLPLNIITLGSLQWLVNVIMLYLVTLLVPAFRIQGYAFPGWSYQGFVVPAANLSTLAVLIITSFFLSLFSSFWQWLVK
jgi:putative membrane protein